MMHFLKNLFCVVLFFSAINPSLTMAQEVRPESQWKILQTAHFEVIFNAKQHNLAVLYAQRLEKAHQILQKYFSRGGGVKYVSGLECFIIHTIHYSTMTDY